MADLVIYKLKGNCSSESPMFSDMSSSGVPSESSKSSESSELASFDGLWQRILHRTSEST